MMKGMQYVFADYEAAHFLERTEIGRAGRLQQGYWAFGRVPLGYSRIRYGVKNYEDVIDETK